MDKKVTPIGPQRLHAAAFAFGMRHFDFVIEKAPTKDAPFFQTHQGLSFTVYCYPGRPDLVVVEVEQSSHQHNEEPMASKRADRKAAALAADPNGIQTAPVPATAPAAPPPAPVPEPIEEEDDMPEAAPPAVAAAGPAEDPVEVVSRTLPLAQMQTFVNGAVIEEMFAQSAQNTGVDPLDFVQRALASDLAFGDFLRGRIIELCFTAACPGDFARIEYYRARLQAVVCGG